MSGGGSHDINKTESRFGLVLVVEDDIRTIRLERFVLEEEGFSIKEANSGEQALEALAEFPPVLVLLDVGLPGIDGFITCQRIRESSQVPIIMVTGQDRDEDKVRGLEMGADDYVTKPFSTIELAARVKAVIRRAEMISTPAKGAVQLPRRGETGLQHEDDTQSALTGTQEVDEPVTRPDEDIYEGDVKLTVESTGSIKGMINFVDELRQSQQFHLLQLDADQRKDGMDILLRLRGPLALKTTLLQMEGVNRVEPPLEGEPDPDQRLLNVSLGR